MRHKDTNTMVTLGIWIQAFYFFNGPFPLQIDPKTSLFHSLLTELSADWLIDRQ